MYCNGYDMHKRIGIDRTNAENAYVESQLPMV